MSSGPWSLRGPHLRKVNTDLTNCGSRRKSNTALRLDRLKSIKTDLSALETNKDDNVIIIIQGDLRGIMSPTE
jgi:hypothetical protein